MKGKAINVLISTALALLVMGCSSPTSSAPQLMELPKPLLPTFTVTYDSNAADAG